MIFCIKQTNDEFFRKREEKKREREKRKTILDNDLSSNCFDRTPKDGAQNATTIRVLDSVRSSRPIQTSNDLKKKYTHIYIYILHDITNFRISIYICSSNDGQSAEKILRVARSPFDSFLSSSHPRRSNRNKIEIKEEEEEFIRVTSTAKLGRGKGSGKE